MSLEAHALPSIPSVSHSSSHTFTLAGEVPVLVASKYTSIFNIAADKRIIALLPYYSSLKITAIEVATWQVCVIDPNGTLGPKPGGAIRYGLIGGACVAPNSATEVYQLPGLSTLPVGVLQAGGATSKYSGQSLSCFELDLCQKTQGVGYPNVILVNAGFAASPDHAIGKAAWQITLSGSGTGPGIARSTS